MTNPPDKNIDNNKVNRVVAAPQPGLPESIEDYKDVVSHEQLDVHYRYFPAQEFIVQKEIEYKKVDIDVFIKDGYKATKHEVTYNEKGFITDDLVEKVVWNEKNTVVINVATGSGKTTAIYRMVKKIIEADPQSVIIMATPFTSLVDKDQKVLLEEYKIDAENITNYKDLSEVLNQENISPLDFANPISGLKQRYIENKRIHITTINGLLRNPGDVAFSQKLLKTNYFEALHDYCTKNHKNVYLFLDEIHASIHNFKNEFIYYLTMWKGVTKKCIVSTATYTEPVNIAIKHLAYLTQDQIQVLEAPRIKAKSVSPLDIIFYSEPYGPTVTKNISEFLILWLRLNRMENSKFHILSYSKKLAKALQGDLEHNFGKINLLTAETKKKDVVFDENINSIGTNFATGVDIKNPNSLLVIIFPVKYSEELVKGEEGIFSDGLPSILQSIARLRSQGRILFVIPPLKGIIHDDYTIKLLNQIPFYTKDKLEIKEDIKIRKEKFLHEEKSLLNEFVSYKMSLIAEKKYKYDNDLVNDPHIKRPHIQFPHEDTFILERGQEFLKYKSYKSGKYVTPYVIWASINDQFINCRLNKVYYYQEKFLQLYLTSTNITVEINKFIKKYLDSQYLSYDFSTFFREACNICKTVTEKDRNEEYKRNVYFLLNGEHIVFSKLKLKNEFFFSLVSIFFKIKPGIITERESYLKYAIENNKLYFRLKKVKNIFLEQHKGNLYQLNEIENLPLFKNNDDLLEEIIIQMNLINSTDEVLTTFKKECKRGDINTSKNGIIKSFINNFITRGPEQQGGRRLIID